MSILHFQSTVSAGTAVSLSDASVTTFALSPETAESRLIFQTDGVLQLDGDSVVNTTWYNSAPQVGVGAGWEVRLTVDTPDAPTQGPAPGVWTSLANTVVWGLLQSTVGAATGAWIVEIRRAGATNPDTEATYTMTSSVSI